MNFLLIITILTNSLEAYSIQNRRQECMLTWKLLAKNLSDVRTFECYFGLVLESYKTFFRSRRKQMGWNFYWINASLQEGQRAPPNEHAAKDSKNFICAAFSNIKHFYYSSGNNFTLLNLVCFFFCRFYPETYQVAFQVYPTPRSHYNNTWTNLIKYSFKFSRFRFCGWSNFSKDEPVATTSKSIRNIRRYHNCERLSNY